jgi:hypothetical protein
MSGADYWAFFTEDAKRTGSLLYSRLAAGIGRDDELKSIAALARPGQPQANMLLAAVHFLLLRGADAPLKRFYPTVGGLVSSELEDPVPDFRAFVLAHRRQVESLVSSRVTNTNEIGRSALLHPGFRMVAAQAATPLALIEIGPSAGLNLIWDSYGVHYNRDGATVTSINANAPLVIDCELRGEKNPPTQAPPLIASRVGLELNPVDLESPDDRDWLRALIWPDQVARMRRLDRAIALFGKAKPEIRAGDALALLPQALASIPASHATCVYHTIAIYQFSREMKEALESILTIAGLRRPIWQLSFEYDGSRYTLLLIRHVDGVRHETVLADCHPHGTWLEWLA